MVQEVLALLSPLDPDNSEDITLVIHNHAPPLLVVEVENASEDRLTTFGTEGKDAIGRSRHIPNLHTELSKFDPDEQPPLDPLRDAVDSGEFLIYIMPLSDVPIRDQENRGLPVVEGVKSNENLLGKKTAQNALVDLTIRAHVRAKREKLHLWCDDALCLELTTVQKRDGIREMDELPEGSLEVLELTLTRRRLDLVSHGVKRHEADDQGYYNSEHGGSL